MNTQLIDTISNAPTVSKIAKSKIAKSKPVNSLKDASDRPLVRPLIFELPNPVVKRCFTFRHNITFNDFRFRIHTANVALMRHVVNSTKLRKITQNRAPALRYASTRFVKIAITSLARPVESNRLQSLGSA